jgi:hypothetical protein
MLAAWVELKNGEKARKRRPLRSNEFSLIQSCSGGRQAPSESLVRLRLNTTIWLHINEIQPATTHLQFERSDSLLVTDLSKTILVVQVTVKKAHGEVQYPNLARGGRLGALQQVVSYQR